MKRVERTVENGLLFLMALKLLARKPMATSELRRAISDAGLGFPHQTTLYTHLGIMKAMKLIEGEGVGRGHRKVYRITKKGLAVLQHAEAHLKSLVARLFLL